MEIQSRSGGRPKRGGGVKISIEDIRQVAIGEAHDVEAVDQLLELLATKDADAARVVELKFFGGLTDQEAARLRRDWEFARSWLRHRVRPSAEGAAVWRVFSTNSSNDRRFLRICL